MKIVDDRIKYLLKEKEIILKEYPMEGSEMQVVMAMANVRIAMELSFLSEVVEVLQEPVKKIPSDKEIDDYFPVIKTQTIKEQNNAIIKRNAVKSFVKNKL